MPQLGPEIDIRPVTRAEAAAWRVLRLEALRTEPTSFSSSYEEVAERDLAFFAAAIPEPGGPDALFGVYLRGELSGSALFRRDLGLKTQHKGSMYGVYLRKALRGRGVGEALVRRLLDHARGQVSQLHCSVTADNGAARDLYRRLGFVEYGLEPRALRYGGRVYDEALLVISFD